MERKKKNQRKTKEEIQVHEKEEATENKTKQKNWRKT